MLEINQLGNSAPSSCNEIEEIQSCRQREWLNQ
jgi:hypothetical protein